jgi:hypothetical protein
LIAKVTKACKKLPDHIREDAAQRLFEGIWAGKIEVTRLDDHVAECSREEYKQRDDGYRTISLDQPLGGTDGARLSDLVTSDREIWGP